MKAQCYVLASDYREHWLNLPREEPVTTEKAAPYTGPDRRVIHRRQLADRRWEKSRGLRYRLRDRRRQTL